MFQLSFPEKRLWNGKFHPGSLLWCVLSELTAVGCERSRPEHREKVGSPAVSAETFAHCTGSSEAGWSSGIFSDWGKKVRPSEPDNYSRRMQITAGSGQPSVPPAAGEWELAPGWHTIPSILNISITFFCHFTKIINIICAQTSLEMLQYLYLPQYHNIIVNILICLPNIF